MSTFVVIKCSHGVSKESSLQKDDVFGFLSTSKKPSLRLKLATLPTRLVLKQCVHIFVVLVIFKLTENPS